MGYRSDGALAIEKEYFDAISLLGNTPSLLKEMAQSHTVNWCDTPFLIFSYENWKMYDSYTDVAEFNQWIESLKLDKYHLIRVGEELEDIESSGDAGMLYVNRNIVWD